MGEPPFGRYAGHLVGQRQGFVIFTLLGVYRTQSLLAQDLARSGTGGHILEDGFCIVEVARFDFRVSFYRHGLDVFRVFSDNGIGHGFSDVVLFTA